MCILRLSAYLVSTVLVVMPPDAFAQTSKPDGLVLDTIVVTPLRRATSLQRSTSSVTVIDKAEIERSASPDLQSLLQYYRDFDHREWRTGLIFQSLYSRHVFETDSCAGEWCADRVSNDRGHRTC